MNTKIYKSVHDIAEQLMKAAYYEDKETFDSLYKKLESICIDNDNTDKDHPVQWETLADFTEDLEEAVVAYEKALEKSVAINSKDHMSSVAHSMAKIQLELGQTDAAIKSLQAAKVNANKITDKELKIEIAELLETLEAQ